MSDKQIMIGSFITTETVHHNKVSGQVTTILTNTLVIVDKHNKKHLVVLRDLMKQGFSINSNEINVNSDLKNTFNPKSSTAEIQRKKQVLIKEVKELANRLNRTPFGREFPHRNQAARLFGSWQNFLIAADIKPTKNNYSDEELFSLVQQLAEKLGRTPVAKEFPHHSIATHRFGRWTKFLEAAGLQSNRQYNSNSERNVYANEELLNKFNLLTEELGRIPQVREFKHYRIALNRFGSWNNFLKTAKATPVKKYSKMSDEQFIKDIQLLAKQLNRTPVFRDYPKAKVAADRFGSWNKFLDIAGIKKENQKE